MGDPETSLVLTSLTDVWVWLVLWTLLVTVVVEGLMGFFVKVPSLFETTI